MKISAKIFFPVAILLFVLMAGGVRAASYDFYVDKNSNETQEDGSSQYPFKTIGAALDHIEDHDLNKKKVYIRDGTYRESIEVRNNTKLIGEKKSRTIIDADGHKNAVEFVSTKSEIRNLTIKKADSTNIIIDKKSRVTIKKCSIKKAGKYGIYVKESSTSDKYKFILKNSLVSDNDSQGIYVSKRRISISKNEIEENGEEGIDLHSSVKGTVSGNSIHGNDESGIEAVLSGASLRIRKNKIKSNHTQGITIQVYSTKKRGKVRIQKNTIRRSKNYGLRFANYTHSIGPRKFKIFVDRYIKLSKNTNKSNGKGELRYE